MKRFKVGDRARIIASAPIRDKYRGRECTVALVGNFPTIHGHRDYVIEVDGIGPATILDEGLEPIQKRPEAGSWDEVEKLTGWNPTKEKVVVR